MRIAVAGARGQLGAAIVHEFAPRHDVTPLIRGDLDISDDHAVRAAMERLRPDAIINCAAYNDVDGAEDHPVDALNVNAFAVRALAGSAAATNAIFVHYSSDFVFEGTASTPYTEDDRPNPRSVYAISKLLGEWFAVDAPRWYVLRVESLFGHLPGARLAGGSVAGILKKLMAGEEATVFEDRTVSPTYVIDAAHATRHLIEHDAPVGLYHCVNSGCCTWLEFARELARQAGVEPRLLPVRLADVRLRAERPRYCALSNQKLVSTGATMPGWQEALARYVSIVRADLGHQAPDVGDTLTVDKPPA
jgi:dTDP-4-dehydrorhamnose reductase